eukprot:TRINITY_DN9217_c0_g1_i1.p1 TRINITY_DN9217_c0_g1~~TRINITY_DN9217_c0_g1_i1.p1  ORF type:complete len:251 (+),score=66.07 TRINITY_DN9217_c0_g1_i1:63-755(+)
MSPANNKDHMSESVMRDRVSYGGQELKPGAVLLGRLQEPEMKTQQQVISKKKDAKRRQRAGDCQVFRPGLLPGTGSEAASTPESCERTSDVEPAAQNRDAETAARCLGDGVTTVMVRNVPNRYVCEEVLSEVMAAGFEDFDFFYLPIDFNSKRNRGYAFINFHTACSARRFALAFHGQQFTRHASRKVLEIAPAVTQGFEENMKAYLKKDGKRVNNQWFRPLIFGREDFL